MLLFHLSLICNIAFQSVVTTSQCVEGEQQSISMHLSASLNTVATHTSSRCSEISYKAAVHAFFVQSPSSKTCVSFMSFTIPRTVCISPPHECGFLYERLDEVMHAGSS